MKPQPLENEEQSNVPSLVTLDMGEVYSLVRAQEARRELPRPTPDLQLRPVGSPVAALTLCRLSPPRWRWSYCHSRKDGYQRACRSLAPWAASHSPLPCGSSTATRTRC